MACSSSDREQTDPVEQQVAAHWDRRAAHFDEDMGRSIRTAAGDAAHAARCARLRLVRRYEVFSGVMNAPMAHAPALVEAWGGKTGDISGVVPAMPGGHVGTSAAVVHPALFPAFCESDN